MEGGGKSRLITCVEDYRNYNDDHWNQDDVIWDWYCNNEVWIKHHFYVFPSAAVQEEDEKKKIGKKES